MPPPTTGSLNGSAEQVLIRLDERMKSVAETLARLDRRIDEDLVTRAEFVVVQKIVFGFVGLILVAVVTALLALVVQTGGAP